MKQKKSQRFAKKSLTVIVAIASYLMIIPAFAAADSGTGIQKALIAETTVVASRGDHANDKGPAPEITVFDYESLKTGKTQYLEDVKLKPPEMPNVWEQLAEASLTESNTSMGLYDITGQIYGITTQEKSLS
ncbi:MAG: hypothetical protein JRH15_11080 [Deltaproteobacteria bacterium]|nr:hypothetical protein [Deltaproteobacteria bacterium]